MTLVGGTCQRTGGIAALGCRVDDIVVYTEEALAYVVV
jgi:hypothetical protein